MSKCFYTQISQEYNSTSGKLTGSVHEFFKGTPTGVTEGPQLYKRDGYYYLLVAESSTGVKHMVSMARSHSLIGPYETDPDYPIMNTAHDLTFALQQAGHGSLVETQDGDWYLAHLCTHPIPGTATMNPLGRETAIQRSIWIEDGWLRLAHGGKLPALNVDAPGLPPHPFEPFPERDDLDYLELGYPYESLSCHSIHHGLA
ncbi:family 43 glycosylhydrolase [Paenibacillus monticola]|uniref:family 43 glycosylhydrolase n=1 Tax=Paenibacillus monticola TaxID=2666075 RepID=UPI001E342C9D|nr:family 43 glycosylhydrolase [Paenibacillus monticola]